MSPGLSRENGELRIRVMKGMVLSTTQAFLLLVGLILLFSIPDLDRLTPGLPVVGEFASNFVRLNLWQKGVAFGLAAIGLNILLRHADLVSFGHAAFFGTGAYTAALLVNKLGVQSFLLIIGTAIAAGILISAVIGFFTLEHTGLYFALITLAFGQVLFSIPKGITQLGGTDGLNLLTPTNEPQVDRVPELLGFPFHGALGQDVIYWISALFVVIGLLIMYRIVKSPFGRALDAIGQERTRARFLGLPVRRYVWAAFIISGIYGAVGGVVYAVSRGSVLPEETLQVFVSGDILYMAILGGFETLTGPLFGGIVIENLTTLADQISIPTWAGTTLSAGNLTTGIVLLIIVFAFPRGIVGTVKDLWRGE